ncbi:MAG: hypothetical protein ABIJ65_08055 [Chloroflexota bacterium]
MNVLSAIVAGLVATLVMSIVLALAPKMGFPKMDIVGMLSTMFSKKSVPVLGWMMHLMMGVFFALIYAFLWSKGIGATTWIYGFVFGAAHWLIVGVIFLMVPMVHVGIRSGTVKEPGLYMTNNGGSWRAFIGGMMGHMIFGLVVTWLYALI